MLRTASPPPPDFHCCSATILTWSHRRYTAKDSRLEDEQAMHDPVVLFDKGRTNAIFTRHYPDQVRKFRMMVKVVTRDDAARQV